MLPKNAFIPLQFVDEESKEGISFSRNWWGGGVILGPGQQEISHMDGSSEECQKRLCVGGNNQELLAWFFFFKPAVSYETLPLHVRAQ